MFIDYDGHNHTMIVMTEEKCLMYGDVDVVMTWMFYEGLRLVEGTFTQLERVW